VQTVGHGPSRRAIQSPASCSPCYLHQETFEPPCSGRPHCMEQIPVTRVYETLAEMLQGKVR